MKNFKQIAFGLLVGAMALSFSAFTTSHNSGMKIHRDAKGKILSVTNTFFRLPADASTSSDNNADHYVFSSGSHAGCTSGTSNICSSEWETTNVPTNGQSPDDAGAIQRVSDNPAQGIYNGQ